MLRLPEHAYLEMIGQALDGYPLEVCGLLAGAGERVDSVDVRQVRDGEHAAGVDQETGGYRTAGIEIDHRHTLGHTDLDSGEADAAGVLHGLEHVVHEAPERTVDLRDRLGKQLQPRIGRFDELENGHGGPR